MADKFIEAVRAALHPERNAATVQRGPLRAVTNVDGDDTGIAKVPPQPAPQPPPPSRSRPVQTTSIASNPSSGPQPKPPSRKRPAQTTSIASNPSSALSKRTRSEKSSRGARYRSHPSQPVLDRLYRSNHHRLYLVGRTSSEGANAAVFAVLGSNANVYHCTISEAPECDCPDFQKRQGSSSHSPCKHLIFVFMRVLKVNRDNPAWWQIRLLPEELSEILASAPDIARLDCMADSSAREHYLRNRPTSAPASSAEPSQPNTRAEGDCPVCFEDMDKGVDSNKPEDMVTSCQGCRQYFHQQCLKRWATAQTTGHSNPTCPLCRALMSPDQTRLRARDKTDGQGYMNLAQFSSSHARPMTLAELYADSHQYIGGGSGRGRGGGSRRRGG